MSAMLLVMLQAGLPAPPPDTIPDRLHVIKPCAPDTSNDILVCGTKDTTRRYRLPPLDDARYEDRPRRAETRLIGNVAGSIEVEQATLAGGVQSKRVMARLKLPF